MLRSMYSGISGMKVNQVKLDVIGNNVANVGTTSFKSQRVRFQDMLSQNMSQALGPGTNQGGVNAKQIGLGVQVAGIDTITSQGMMQPTSRNLDVAMDGDGYFIVGTGPAKFDDGSSIPIGSNHTMGSGAISPSYTRDGSFTLDTDGNLLTSDGYRVMGYSISNGLTDASRVESIQGNTVDGKKEGQLNFVDGNGTEFSSDGKIIVDKHAATASGTFAAPVAGAVKMTVDGVEKSITFATDDSVDKVIDKINAQFPGVASKDKDGKLVLTSPTKGYGSSINILDDKGDLVEDFCGIKSFATKPVLGTLDVVDNTKTPAIIQTMDAIGTAQDSTKPLVDKDMLKPLRIPDKIYETSYSIAKDSNGNLLASDGTVATAAITDFKLQKDVKELRIRTFSIDKDGSIKAVLEDGRVSVLGQIGMATFKNPAGLQKLGKNLYQNSDNSGEAVVRSGMGAPKGTDNSEGYGDCAQGMLEMSNVDLAEQFTDMIVASRAFQASGKTITTGDEILQDIINLKR